MLLMLVSACATAAPTSGESLCDGTRAARADLAAAVAVTPDDQVAVAGAQLVALIDAGCAR